jgi:glucose/arabinose dehydrogenase
MARRTPGRHPACWTTILVLLAPLGCMPRFRSKGGGELGHNPPERRVSTGDIAVPAGYQIEAVATGLTFPTGVAFDEQGEPYVVESGYAYGEVFTTPRLLHVGQGGRIDVVTEGERNGPWNGIAYAGGAFFVSEGGEMEGGRILKISRSGETTVVAAGMPSQGDHHTDGPVVRDGWIYFGQGTVTNSGVVGEDNAQFGWLRRQPALHDIPCRDITLTGQNFQTSNPLTPDPDDRATTGAFSAFGTPSRAGQVVKGQLPCNGAIMRVKASGGPIELVAWGFRNPYGLAFAPDGRLFVADNGFDERGSRPVFGAADMLWEVKQGQWYGWPDFAEGRPISMDRYGEGSGPRPKMLLASQPGQPPRPAAYLAVHSSSDGLDFSTSDAFGHKGDAFIAQFGDQAPVVGKVTNPVGYKVVRVEPDTGVVADFAVNRGKKNGPASLRETGGLERPLAVRFGPRGTSLYVVDFGVMTMDGSAHPQEHTGVLWRITRTGGSR